MPEFPKPESVHSYTDLASFLTQAADDLEAHPDAWENATLEDFLRAWSAWLEDSPGYYANIGEKMPLQPSWADIAGMVLAGKIYE